MTRPLRLGLPGRTDTRVLALLVPRALIPAPPHEVARLTAVRMVAEHRTSGLASTVLQRLARHLDEYEGAEAVRISTIVVDLLATAFASCLDPPGIATPEQRRGLLRHRVYGYIEERLGDPRLRGRPVSAIAAHWGFRDATHFSRAFRGAFGVPPARYRDAYHDGGMR